MARDVTAVYERGILRPLNPLDLRERQKVRIRILDDPQEDEAEKAIQILITAGLMHQPDRSAAPLDPVSEEERRALAERLGQAPGQSLSELVIEDRGEW